eukprot:COSAG01_NODE_1871_length_9009_cov_5.036139_2_plen_63_part_00
MIDEKDRLRVPLSPCFCDPVISTPHTDIHCMSVGACSGLCCALGSSDCRVTNCIVTVTCISR